MKTGSQKNIEVRSIEEHRARKVMKIEKTQKAMEQMHRDVSQRMTDKRRKEVARHNSCTNIRAINVGEGEFVLRGVFRKDRGGK